MPRQLLRTVIIMLLLFVFLANKDSYAQRWKLLRYQTGFGIGTTQIFGDIGGTADQENWFGIKDISFDETKMAYGGYLRYKLNTLFSVKASLNGGFGKGTDIDSRNDRGRSYKATFIEFSGQVEHYFLSEEPRHKSAAMFNKRGMINNFSSLSAYTFVGLGVTYSILKHEYGNGIAPVDSYKASNVAPVIPFGLGVKYVIDERVFLGAEFGYRWALNDYVEGYKQTQASKSNDLYYFLMFSANYRLKTTRRNIPAFLDKKYKKYGI